MPRRDSNSSSNPKCQTARADGRARAGDASCREEGDHDQEGEGSQDARGDRLETLGGFSMGGFDLPIDLICQ